MRTPADCINALNGCVRVGNPKRWTLAVEEEIANDIIANFERLEAIEAAAKAYLDHYDGTPLRDGDEQPLWQALDAACLSPTQNTR
jgi:hypothetical protein